MHPKKGCINSKTGEQENSIHQQLTHERVLVRACMYTYACACVQGQFWVRGEQISRDLEGFQDYNMITADCRG